MADWEDETNSTKPTLVAPKTSKWDDEDASDEDVKDAWDDSEEESEDEAPKAPPPQPKKKVPLSQRIAERNAENARKKEEMAARQSAAQADTAVQETEEELFERRQREKRMQEASDLENAVDLFGGVSVKDQDTASKITTLTPKSKEEFDEFAKLLVARIQESSKSGLYPTFLADFTRQLYAPLKDVYIRKGASVLTALANEKQKAEREKNKKGKKKAAPQLKQVDDMDNTDYGAAAYQDEFDDFM
ncbi:MAG: eukaryotic translation initiation factor 3 subunit J [Piptocephalis tieghemiana]|nr:MAG: eukaryotic translation initiation factor 3 subunit J [Piptocephalis tieghemiana]